MYTENDYRYYLAHGKWTWPGGKNSKAYNSWYYQNHKEKWKKGIEEGVDYLEKNADDIADQIGELGDFVGIRSAVAQGKAMDKLSEAEMNKNRAKYDLNVALMDKDWADGRYKSTHDPNWDWANTFQDKYDSAREVNKAKTNIRIANEKLAAASSDVQKAQQAYREAEAAFSKTILGRMTKVAEKIGKKLMKRWGF